MRIKLYVFAIVMMVNLNHANTIKEIGINEIWNMVQEWHPLVQSNGFSLDSKDGEIEQSSKKINPEIAIELEEFGGNKARSGTNDALIQMSYSQTFERGNKRNKRVSVSKVEKDLTNLENQKLLLELYFEMKEKYLETNFAKSKLKLEKSLYKMTLEFENILKKLVRYGKISPLGLERAKILRSRSEIDLDDSKNEFNTAKMELFSLFNGSEKINNFTLRAPQELKTIQDQTWENSLNIKILQTKEVLQQELLTLEKSKAKQDYTIGGALQNFTGNDETAFVLSYSIPLGFHDQNQGGIRAQKARVRIQQQNTKQALLELKKEVAKLNNLILVGKKKLSKLNQTVLPSSKRLYTQVLKAQSAGKSDYLEVLEARKNLIENRRLHLETKRDLYMISNQIEKLLLNKALEKK